MSDVISFVIQVVFLALFLGTGWRFLRHRDPLSRDVMLVFAAVAAVFVTSLLNRLLGGLPTWTTFVVIAALLAQPLLVLRVCALTGEVRRAVWVAALVAYVATVIPFLLVPDPQPWMVLPAVMVFLAIEAVAGWYLARAGLQRVGAARLRLLTAAGATGLFGLSLVVLGIGSGDQTGGEVASLAGRGIALLAALGYALAFLPVGWLRRIWTASTAFEFTQRLIEGPPDSAEHAWGELIGTTRAMSGAGHAIVLITDASGGRTAIGAEALTAEGPVSELSAAAAHGREVSRETWPRTAEALGVGDGQAFLSALRFEMPRDATAILAWITPRRSLFAEDDRGLLAILSRRAGIFAERAATLQVEASLNQRLAATNVALARASEAKSDFLASMSHELRTPLATVIGFSSLMRDEPSDGDAVSVPREWVEHVHSSGEHLLGLINDVLDLSKVEAGRLELDLHRFDLATAVTDLMGGMRPLADRKQIRLTFDVPAIQVVADRGRMRQILYNLVSNAIKFTPDGGRVAISAARVDTSVELTVTDTGVGIAPEDHERVFHEFQQVGDAAARQAGTGLGLALTRRLVEAHGGRIALESAIGDGSRFTVILLDVLLPGKDGWDVLRELKADPVLRDVPVVVVSAVDERHLGLTLGAVDYFLKPVDRDALLARLSRYTYTTKVLHQTVRVLVVDDDPAALQMVDGALTPAGFEVVLAGSGREGIERASAERVHLVICDLLMPDLDGFEVVQRLRADPATADVPILILTAHDLSAADKQRLNGHILGVVSKDGDVRSELERWIARAIGAARRRAQAEAPAR